MYTGLQYSDTATATLAGLKQDAYFLGHCSAASISDGDMNRIINKYYFQLQEVVRQINENFYMTIATTDLLKANDSYTYPNGTGTAPSYEKIRSLWIALNPAIPATPQDYEYQRMMILDPDSISNPTYEFTEPTALMFGNYFTIPTMALDSTPYPVINGVKCYYIKENDKLINDTDVPDIFPSFHGAIVQGALIDIAERLRNEQLKQDSIATFKKRLEDIAAYASARLPAQVGVPEGQDNLGGWEYPWGRTLNGM